MTTTDTTPAAAVQHAPWCSQHMADRTPADGWCEGDKVTVAGIETYLICDQPTHEVTICIRNGAGRIDRTLSEVEQLMTRLADLVREARAPEPADEGAVKTLRMIANAHDTTLEAVAAEIGADAASLTRGDVDALAEVFGRLAAPHGSSGWSVGLVQDCWVKIA
jgi:hypothetical protein